MANGAGTRGRRAPIQKIKYQPQGRSVQVQGELNGRFRCVALTVMSTRLLPTGFIRFGVATLQEGSRSWRAQSDRMSSAWSRQ